MHDWRDANVDWQGITDAAHWIADRLRGYGIHVSDAKEKWGTVRVYCSFNDDKQREIYRRVYAEALMKWPHLSEEIIGGADFGELLHEL